MARTVNGAFNEFMKNTVNLDSIKTSSARTSRDNLKNQISKLEDFFPMYSEKNIDFGSFARRTKIRPLDDIDMIFTLSANGCTWEESFDGTVYIQTPDQSPEYGKYRHDSSNRLNSRKVINKFIQSLSKLNHYRSAVMHRNLNAATLQLTSYDWNFDVVPAFFTTENYAGKSYYIIPDGNGNWIKTDPRIDRQRVSDINKQCDGRVLNAIRVMKYWQRRATMPSMPSYLLESMVLNYFENKGQSSSFIDLDIIDILYYIKDHIFHPINDPKGIQGDLNKLSFEDKSKISKKAETDFNTALSAREFEGVLDHEKAINEWRKIFGYSFPQFG